MRVAGYILLLSAALHVLAVVLAAFSPDAVILLVPAVLYLLLAAGLSRGMLWVAWISFICMIVGAAGALSAMFGAWPVPVWVFASIFVADLAAAVLLFGTIWSGSKKETAQALE